MKILFDELAQQVSKSTTEKYSTSFSLGILALNPKIRPAIYSIYGYVRLADEIVDSFHGYDRSALLARLREQTDQAIAERISINPILQSFQEIVNRYQIDHALIDQFLKSMEMDLERTVYDGEKYQTYIFGSAEVVGLMCLQVFVDGNNERYAELRPFAMKLGSAFQKVNFLRDFADDVDNLGRTYFPGVNGKGLDQHTKSNIEKEIEHEFDSALIGIRKLPRSARFGVYLAYKYYYSLFRKIKRATPQQILKRRIRIPNRQKFSLMMSSYVKYKISLI